MPDDNKRSELTDNQRGRGGKGKLYGIGLGPGDPKLLTLKARELLDEVDMIFVPKAWEDGISLARSIIETATLRPRKFVELIFPMTRDKKRLRVYWQRAARKISREVRKRKKVAFVTIGDPLIYSTYVYLLKTLRRDFPDMAVETIPGISAFNAAASRAQLPLVEGEESLAILPVRKNLKGLKRAFQEFDTVVLMKVGKKLGRVRKLLGKLGLIKNAILISRVGQADELIRRDLSKLKDKNAGYLSVIIVKRKKTG